MLTAVIYQKGDCGLISTDHLNELIVAGEIKQFLRLEGWTTVDLEPIRKELRVDYKGPERRQQFLSFHANELVNIKLNI
jgi:hypothetical protein